MISSLSFLVIQLDIFIVSFIRRQLLDQTSVAEHQRAARLA